MKIRFSPLSFLIGFVIATAIGLTFVVPASKIAWRTNMDSDVHRGIHGALVFIEESANQGDCEKAAAQLNLLNKRFEAYRNAGGPPPSDWMEEVIATTRPAN
ncbi:MAG TPA: hypothetical protein VGN72_20435 [Tepidisphaeraceae bacterium]|jgi:hypothetical protein|nr:hypothetical protein [Tepidisphaeraceae bacterium]